MDFERNTGGTTQEDPNSNHPDYRAAIQEDTEYQLQTPPHRATFQDPKTAAAQLVIVEPGSVVILMRFSCVRHSDMFAARDSSGSAKNLHSQCP